MANENNKEVEIVEEQVRDLSGQELTFAERMNQWEKNEVKLCATVTKVKLGDPKPKTVLEDGKKVPQIIEGIIQYWDTKLYVDIAFTGGSMTLAFAESDMQHLQEGQRYLFSGRMALNYGSVQAVLNNYVKMV